MNKQLNVIAFTHGEEPLSALRVRAPLMSLYEQGEIESWCVIYGDGELAGPHQMDTCNAMLIMRDCLPSLSQVLSKFELPYLYDLDDLLLLKPAYSEIGTTAGNIEKIASNAKLISFATPTLERNFRKYSRLDAGIPSTIVPNGLLLPQAPKQAIKPSAVVWTSADRSSLLESRNAVCSAISTFCRETGLPLYLFGSHEEKLLTRVPEKRIFGNVNFFSHKLFLAQHPGLIGVAPLETVGDRATLDFVNSKSDLKMVEFGGYGHPAVYSDAIPYATSDLRTGVICENAYHEWLNGLRTCLVNYTEDKFINQEAIIKERDIRVVARNYWLPALQDVAMAGSFSVKTLCEGIKAANDRI